MNSKKEDELLYVRIRSLVMVRNQLSAQVVNLFGPKMVKFSQF